MKVLLRMNFIRRSWRNRWRRRKGCFSVAWDM